MLKGKYTRTKGVREKASKSAKNRRSLFGHLKGEFVKGLIPHIWGYEIMSPNFRILTLQQDA